MTYFSFAYLDEKSSSFSFSSNSGEFYAPFSSAEANAGSISGAAGAIGSQFLPNNNAPPRFSSMNVPPYYQKNVENRPQFPAQPPPFLQQQPMGMFQYPPSRNYVFPNRNSLRPQNYAPLVRGLFPKSAAELPPFRKSRFPRPRRRRRPRRLKNIQSDQYPNTPPGGDPYNGPSTSDINSNTEPSEANQMSTESSDSMANEPQPSENLNQNISASTPSGNEKQDTQISKRDTDAKAKKQKQKKKRKKNSKKENKKNKTTTPVPKRDITSDSSDYKLPTDVSNDNSKFSYTTGYSLDMLSDLNGSTTTGNFFNLQYFVIIRFVDLPMKLTEIRSTYVFINFFLKKFIQNI